jgi:2-phospho-L-lactate guanylyltransferase
MHLVKMTTWAIIPVKHLSMAKSSLSRVLNPPQRRELVLSMLADVLNAIHKASSVKGAIVVSPDEEGVLEFAKTHSATGIADHGAKLNDSLDLAIKQAMAKGATSVLILPLDIPLLTPADIKNIISMASSHRAVVIAPSKDNGTNALFLRPADVMNLRFGGESFPAHLAEARVANIRPQIYRSTTVATDIDEIKDMLSIDLKGLGTRTREFLTSFRSHVKSGTNL